MKMYQVYVCEKCGKESQNHDEIELCETIHMGLNTLEEKHTYDSLKAFVEYCGNVVSTTNNDRARKDFDEAIEKLIAFEKEHGMEV